MGRFWRKWERQSCMAWLAGKEQTHYFLPPLGSFLIQCGICRGARANKSLLPLAYPPLSPQESTNIKNGSCSPGPPIPFSPLQRTTPYQVHVPVLYGVKMLSILRKRNGQETQISRLPSEDGIPLWLFGFLHFCFFNRRHGNQKRGKSQYAIPSVFGLEKGLPKPRESAPLS